MKERKDATKKKKNESKLGGGKSVTLVGFRKIFCLMFFKRMLFYQIFLLIIGYKV